MMAIKEFLTFVLLISSITADMSDMFRPKTVRISKFRGTCPEHKDAPIALKNVHLQSVNRMVYFSFDATIKREVQNDIKLVIGLTRCKNQQLDSCEGAQSITVNHLCTMLNLKSAPWSGVIESLQPPIHCPLKKGAYRMANSTMDASAISHLPFGGYYWRIQPIVYDEVTNDLLLCVYTESQIIPL